MNNKQTLIAPDVWFQPANLTQIGVSEQDQYCMQSLWIFARIVNVLAVDPAHDRTSAIAEELWTELLSWNIERPDALRPVLEFYPSKDKSVFPRIIFSSPSACMLLFFPPPEILFFLIPFNTAYANVLYHAGSILLCESTKLSTPEGLRTIVSLKCKPENHRTQPILTYFLVRPTVPCWPNSCYFNFHKQ